MQVTTKGQVTIPEALRKRYGFLPHTEVEFFEDQGKVYLVKPHSRQRRGKILVEHLRGTATVKMTTDEIMALTRGE